MGFTEYLKLARDLAIVAGIGFILWFVWHARADKDEITSLKADIATLKQNDEQRTRWQGDITHGLETATLNQKVLMDYLSANHKPIIVRVPASQPVPTSAGGPAAQPAHAGGVPEGHDEPVQLIDIRPMWNAYVAKWGGALIDGQKCYDSWPQ